MVVLLGIEALEELPTKTISKGGEMGLTEFTFFIMVTFLPGIVAYKIIDELTVHEEHKTHEVIIVSFLYGFLSYLLYYCFFSLVSLCINWNFTFHLFETLKSQQSIDFGEIFRVTCFGVLVGLLLTWIDTNKYMHRIAKSIGLIYKHGDLDTFTYLMRSNIGKEPWVIVRDVEDDRAYAGWIAEYSIGEEQNELFLRDVVVFQNSTGELMMTSPGIYLAKPKDKYVIEFTKLEYGDIMDQEIVRKANEKWNLENKEPSK